MPAYQHPSLRGLGERTIMALGEIASRGRFQSMWPIAARDRETLAKRGLLARDKITPNGRRAWAEIRKTNRL